MKIFFFNKKPKLILIFILSQNAKFEFLYGEKLEKLFRIFVYPMKSVTQIYFYIIFNSILI